MEAANTLCRWLLAAALATAAGCQSDGASAMPMARGQQPPEPVGARFPVMPGAPTLPSVTVPAAPVVPGAPIPGSPVTPSNPADPGVRTTGYSTLPNLATAAELMKEGTPRVKVVALVGASNLVTDEEVIEAVRKKPELIGMEGRAREAKEKELYAAELRRIIERELILDDMYTRLKKNGKLAVVDEIKDYAEKAAEQNIRAIRKFYGIKSDADFLDWLKAQGLTEQVLRREFVRQMMADEYVHSMLKERSRNPGFAEIRVYYERHPDEFNAPDRVKWQDIFVSFNQHPTPQAAYNHADAIRRQAASGADFLELVKKYDNGLSAKTKDGLGIGEKRGEIKPVDVEPALWELQAGQVSGLIQTAVGYHIVKVMERDYAGLRPLDTKVQGEIRRKLMEQYRKAEVEKMIDELWRKGAVRVIEMP
jgi:parvulin-like peptidyl-prolyl isomerase